MRKSESIAPGVMVLLAEFILYQPNNIVNQASIADTDIHCSWYNSPYGTEHHPLRRHPVKKARCGYEISRSARGFHQAEAYTHTHICTYHDTNLHNRLYATNSYNSLRELEISPVISKKKHWLRLWEREYFIANRAACNYMLLQKLEKLTRQILKIRTYVV